MPDIDNKKCRSDGVAFRDAALAILEKVKQADAGPGGIDADDVSEVIEACEIDPPVSAADMCEYTAKMKAMLDKVIKTESAIQAMQEDETGPVEGCSSSVEISRREKRAIVGGWSEIRVRRFSVTCEIAGTAFSGEYFTRNETDRCDNGYVPTARGCKRKDQGHHIKNHNKKNDKKPRIH